MGAAGVMNLSRPSPAARLLASLLPSESVRIKPVQVVKIDRVVVNRRMQDHAVMIDVVTSCLIDALGKGETPTGWRQWLQNVENQLQEGKQDIRRGVARTPACAC
jgi:hypothetical protein